jgi:hypothetical protein
MKFLILILALGLFRPNWSEANSCPIFLSTQAVAPQGANRPDPQSHSTDLDRNTIEMPGRGHKFTASDLSRMTEDNRLRVLLLKAGLSVLDRSEVVLALKAINQPLIYFTENPDSIVVPEALIEISKRQVKAENVNDNYKFFKSYLNQDFSEQELMGLSLLFADVKRPKKASPAISYIPKNKIEREKYINYLIGLLSRPHIANALIRFLNNDWISGEATAVMKTAQAQYAHDALQRLERDSIADKALDVEASFDASMRWIQKTLVFNPEKMTEEYNRKGKFSETSMNVILSVLDHYADLLYDYYESEAKQHPSLFRRVVFNEKPVAMSDLTRPERLIIIEKFLTDVAHFKSVLGNLVDLIEHLIFGSAMPLKTEELESMIKDSVKLWLMPVRAQISSFKAEDNNRTQAELRNAQLSAIEPTILSPVWGHSPVEVQALNPNKRRNQSRNRRDNRRDNDNSQTSSEVKNIEVIPDSKNLARFSNFSQNQRSVEELTSSQTYKFRFMRDGEDSKIYSIEFIDSVLKEFNQNPEVANLLLRALNLGFARTTHEDGLKILKTNKNGQAGRLYELKSRKSTVRLILQHNDGHWRVLRYTDKTNFVRVLNDLI